MTKKVAKKTNKAKKAKKQSNISIKSTSKKKKSVSKKISVSKINGQNADLEQKAFRRDMPVGDAVSVFPGAAQIMLSYGLHCIGCGMNAFETIEQGCMGHGMGDEEINALVDELNEAYEEYKKGNALF